MEASSQLPIKDTISRIITKADLIMIVLLITSALLFMFLTFTRGQQNPKVIIHYQHSVLTTESLNQEKKIVIDSLAVVLISNGKAKIDFSTCPNQSCLRQGWSNSYPIICVPNQIFLEFTREKKNVIYLTY